MQNPAIVAQNGQVGFNADDPHEPRPFRCEYCAKTYTRLDHLSRHLRSHTKEKPFECSICQKSFSRRDLLNRHASVHEPDQNSAKRQRLSSVATSRASQACTACASSKLKCDGASPCSRCISKQLVCHYAQRSQPSKPVDDSIMADLPSNHSTANITQVYDLAGPLNPDNSTFTSSAPEVGVDVDQSPHVFDFAPTAREGDSSMQQNTNRTGSVTQYQSPFDSISSYDEADLYFATFLSDVMGHHSMTADDHMLPSFDMDSYAPLDLLDFSTDNLYQDMVGPQPSQLYNRTDNLGQGPRLAVPELASGTATPNFGRSGLSLGIQAFKESLWNYAPSANNHNRADQLNLSIAINSSDRDGSAPALESRWPALNHVQRDRILATVISQCDANIVPQVVSSFPSADLLSGLVHLFLTSQDSDDDGYIHTASFDPNEQHTVFLLAAVAAGAVQSDNSDIRRLGYAFQEAARTAVAEMFESDNRNVRSLRSLQSHSIHLDVGLWSGDRRRLEIAESFSLPLITMMKRGGFFRHSHLVELPLESDPPHLVEDKWRRWIEQESLSRLAFHMLAKDVQTSISLQNAPLMSIHEMTIPIPLARDLWRAKSAAQWKQICLDRYGDRGLDQIPSARACADNISRLAELSQCVDVEFATTIMLCSMWMMSWQFRELLKIHHNPTNSSTKLVFQSLREETLRALEQAEYHLDDFSGGLNTRSKIMLERIKMNMHVSLEDVQLLAGKAGEDEARRVYPSLKAWAAGTEARHAIWHAGQIFKFSRDMPTGRLQGFSAVVLYHASLVLWAYSILPTPMAENLSKEAMTHNISLQGITTSGSRSSQSAVHGRTVQLDDAENSAVQRFMAIGTGTPSIVSYKQDQTRQTLLPLTDAQGIMSSIRCLLKERGGPRSNNGHASLIENLAKLMKSLGKAANAMRAGQKTLSSLAQNHATTTK